MASPPLQLHLTLSSAKDLKNVNWRHGNLIPYAVVWIDPNAESKYSTKVDEDGDTSPHWNQTLIIPFASPIQDSTLSIDIVQAYAAKDTKPLIGSTRIPIQDIVNDVGFGEWTQRTLKLKRPSGRPQGTLQIELMVRPNQPQPQPQPYYAPPPPYHSQPEPYYAPYPYTPPTSGYPYAQPGYAAPSYSTGAPEVNRTGGSKFGVGTGLAVGAVAGALGGLALVEGVDYVEDKIADDVQERVEDDLGFDDGGFGGDDF